MIIYISGVSSEPLEIIRVNECDAQEGLCTSRFRALWNEIERLRAAGSYQKAADYIAASALALQGVEPEHIGRVQDYYRRRFEVLARGEK